MFQLSLRSLMVLVALVALAVVSVRFASPGWRTAVLTIALVTFWLAVTLAVFDRGPRQAFATGLALTMVIYALAVLWAGPLTGYRGDEIPEFNPERGRLPTTQILNLLFHALADVRYVDIDTGQVVKDYDPIAAPVLGGARVTLNETPSRHAFAAIGHLWWALLLGLCGGWFARLIYLGRMRQPKLP